MPSWRRSLATSSLLAAAPERRTSRYSASAARWTVDAFCYCPSSALGPPVRLAPITDGHVLCRTRSSKPDDEMDLA